MKQTAARFFERPERYYSYGHSPLFIFSGCPEIDPLASAGVIYSPNFPWTYPTGKWCNWTIRAPLGKMVNLNFTHFHLESGSSYCGADFVEVQYNYYSYYMNNRRKFCGSKIPSSISKYGSISVTFYSDFSLSYSGFLAFYQMGYSFTTTTSPVTPYTYPIYPTTVYMPVTSSPYGACRPYSNNSKLLL